MPPGSSGASDQPCSEPSTSRAPARSREELARRWKIGRRGGGQGDPADLLGIGACQPVDDRWIGGEPDDVAGRERPVVLGHREVLVHDPPSLVQHHPQKLLLLDAEQQYDATHPVGKLPSEPAQHVGVAVADVVVDGDPSVPRRRDERAARSAREAGDELPDGRLDAAQVVRLDVDRAEGSRLALAETLGELGDRGRHDDHVVAEPPPTVQRACDAVRHLYVQVDVLHARLAERIHDCARELGAHSPPADVAVHVEVGQRRERRRPPTDEREPDRAAVVVLGEERDLGGEDVGHLAELLAHVGRPCVHRWRQLVIELLPETGDLLEVVRRRASDVHPCILAPASRNCADRFWKGAKRSPMRRTSSIESGRPSA